jgi:hypothetical protein
MKQQEPRLVPAGDSKTALPHQAPKRAGRRRREINANRNDAHQVRRLDSRSGVSDNAEGGISLILITG